MEEVTRFEGVRDLNRIALYRAWRPQTFRDVVGQHHITQTLMNSLREAKVSHAYLFSGPRGTGKTSMAKILAKAVNCERGLADAPCNECSSCRRIQSGSVIDVVEIDAASNRGVEEIRDIREKVRYAPTEVRRKVYIIDEVHMLTPEAFNALLKTLEEPPEHAMFILATTEPHKLPATIVSRCQRFDFRRIPLAEQVDRLREICRKEGIEAEDEALRYLARLSDGGMRDALSLLDQAATFAGDRISYESVVAITGGISQEHFRRLATAVSERNIGAALTVVDQLIQDGKSADKCLEQLLLYFRDLLMSLMAPNSLGERVQDVTEYRVLAEQFGQKRLFSMIETLNRYQSELRYSVQPQMMFEVAVLKLCTGDANDAQEAPAQWKQQLDELRTTVHQLQQQIVEMKRRLESSGPVSAEVPSGDMRGSSAVSRSTPKTGGASSSGGVQSKVALEPFKQQADRALLDQIKARWATILQQVKERKITVHAWLIDGEPVAATERALLLAFKSAMHRETTAKPANRQLIEETIAQVLGRPMSIVTVMRKEWNEAQSAGEQETAKPEPLQLVPEDRDKDEQDWIKQAIELFGEDLVTIRDD
jgi:DNA polymerase-3 subunit gamma/tau